MDLQQLLAAAQQMQDHLMSAQQELADAEVEGTSGGGLVKARVNGQGELVELTISPAAIDPADPADTAQTVADLVLAAVHNALTARSLTCSRRRWARWPPASASPACPRSPACPGCSAARPANRGPAERSQANWGPGSQSRPHHDDMRD